MDKLLIISKYNEPVDWISSVSCDYIIYDKSETPIEKSISRPNIGREAETLLYYIITNYYNLPELIIFLQGDPRFNPIKFTYEQIVQKINSTYISELNSFLEPMWCVEIEKYWAVESGEICKILFNKSGFIKYSSGAEYFIPKNNILCRPYDFYERLHAKILQFGNKGFDSKKMSFKSEGISAWAIEPIWYTIFDSTVKLNNNYKEILS